MPLLPFSAVGEIPAAEMVVPKILNSIQHEKRKKKKNL